MIPLRLAVYGAAGAALLAGVLYYGHTRHVAGRAAVQARFDAFVATQHQQALSQLEAQKTSLLAYQRQVSDAETTRVENERILADLRARSAPRLRCTTASPSPYPVPAATPGASGGPTSAGELQAGSGTRAESFDPVADIMRLADRADDLVESCRSALARWPQPSSNP